MVHRPGHWRYYIHKTCICFSAIVLYSFSVTCHAATDITWSYDSGGGHDYSALGTFEGHIDNELDMSGTSVMTGITWGAGDSAVDFPPTSDVHVAGEGSGSIVALFTNSEGTGTTQVAISGVTEDWTGDTVILDSDGSKTFVVTAADTIKRAILDCYDSQNHDDSVDFNGPVNKTATRYVLIRSSPSCSTPFSGVSTSGAHFYYTGAVRQIISVETTYIRVQNLVFSYDGNYAGRARSIDVNDDFVYVISNVFPKGLNAGGDTFAIELGDNGLTFNNIIYDIESGGIASPSAAGNTNYIVCNTIINTGGFGWDDTNLAIDVLWSNYAAGNASGDYDEGSHEGVSSAWNASADNTSDMDGDAGDNYKNGVNLLDGRLDGNYLPLESIDWNGAAGDRAGRNPYDDFSSELSDLEDFFKNDTDGEAISKLDIQGVSRNLPNTADSAWDVGAGEYFVAAEFIVPMQIIINAN